MILSYSGTHSKIIVVRFTAGKWNGIPYQSHKLVIAGSTPAPRKNLSSSCLTLLGRDGRDCRSRSILNKARWPRGRH